MKEFTILILIALSVQGRTTINVLNIMECAFVVFIQHSILKKTKQEQKHKIFQKKNQHTCHKANQT